MKRTLKGMTDADKPLLLEVLEAIRAHQRAQDGGATPETVVRLSLLADSLFHAVAEFQLLENGSMPESITAPPPEN